MRRPPKEQRRTAEPSASTYHASLIATATLAAFLTILCMVVLNERSVTRIVDDLVSQTYTVDARDAPLLFSFVVVPVVIALASSGVVAAAIQMLRISLYVRRVHRQAQTYLHRSAPLQRYSVELHSAPIDRGTLARQGKEQRVSDALRANRRLLLLGEPGAGKTGALHALLDHTSRRGTVLGHCFGRRPLPVLLTFGDYADTDLRDDDLKLESLIRQQLFMWGTPGLAARLPRIKRRQGVLVLCDQLEVLPEALRTRIGHELLTITKGSTASRVIVAYPMSMQAIGRDLADWSTDFQTVGLGALSEAEVHRVLLDVRAPRSAHRPRKSELGATLARHRLDTGVRLPVGLAALVPVWASGDPLPYGRAALYLRSLELGVCAPGSIDDDTSTLRSLRALGAIASAMRRSRTQSIPMRPDVPMGTATALWLAEHEPLLSTEVSDRPKLTLNGSETQDVCQWTVERGILAQFHTGAPITFANTVIGAMCAAWWLWDCDDGLSRLSPELLRPEWRLPVLLWAGVCNTPTDLAHRLLRLADTPEASAARAGLPSKEMVWPLAATLSLAAACEGMAAQLARSRDEGGDSPALLAASEQHLRDLLDSLLAQVVDGNLPVPVFTALHDMAATAGPDLCASIDFLARDTRLSSLVRAQLVTLLGALASREAVDLLTRRLTDPDPLIRQALPIAMRLSGRRALDAVSATLGHPDRHTRERAAEALAELGDVAVMPLLAALQGTSAGERIAAAQALRKLRPHEAETLLVARLDDDILEVRVASALSLGSLGTHGAVAALVAHAQAPNPDMRAAIAEALGQTRAPDSLSVLEGLLDDSAAEVRTAAATALGLLGDDRALPVLLRRRGDADPITQNAVATALRRLGRA